MIFCSENHVRLRKVNESGDLLSQDQIVAKLTSASVVISLSNCKTVNMLILLFNSKHHWIKTTAAQKRNALK